MYLMRFCYRLPIILLCLTFFVNMNVPEVRAGLYCYKFKRIANDPEKVKYLKDWAINNIRRDDILDVFGESGSADFSYSFEKYEPLGLDLEYVGMEVRYSRVDLNWNITHNIRDPDIIKSITFGYGRDSIIISTGDDPELGIFNFDLRKDNIEKIGDGVYIYCR